MQESCPPPPDPPQLLEKLGGVLRGTSTFGARMNFAALHSRLKVHRIADSAMTTAPGLPNGT